MNREPWTCWVETIEEGNVAGIAVWWLRHNNAMRCTSLSEPDPDKRQEWANRQVASLQRLGYRYVDTDAAKAG